MYILVTYDVNTADKAGQRRLNKVAKACKNYGHRVQNSVFECELTEAQFVILKDKLATLMDKTLDSIRFYYLNKNENRRIISLGRETALNVDGAIIV